MTIAALAAGSTAETQWNVPANLPPSLAGPLAGKPPAGTGPTTGTPPRMKADPGVRPERTRQPQSMAARRAAFAA